MKFIIIIILFITLFLFYPKKNNIEHFNSIDNDTLLKKCIKPSLELIDFNKRIPECSYRKYDGDNDWYNCDRIKLDNYMIKINDQFTKLRCIEYMPDIISDDKYKYFIKIYKKLYKILYIEREFKDISVVIFQEYMKELYYRSVYYYPVLNKRWKINNIPVYSYLKNNQCLIPLLRNKIKQTLLHFDTHPDDNKPYEHYKEYKKLISNLDDASFDRISQITYDIGCFSAYYVAYAQKNFIWLYPKWNNKTHETYFKKKKKQI